MTCVYGQLFGIFDKRLDLFGEGLAMVVKMLTAVQYVAMGVRTFVRAFVRNVGHRL